MPPRLEHRILTTATLCLLAFGAVMVYSASAPLGAVNGGGGTGEFLRYLMVAGLGLGLMRALERRGMDLIGRPIVALMMAAAFFCLLAVLVPGVGIEAGGARRWLGSSVLEFQPSEVMKLALVLWLARYLACAKPARMRRFKPATMPILLRVLPACGLIVLEPDLGTALVVAFTVAALLIAAGMPMRHVALLGLLGIAGVALMLLVEPYERSRLVVFLNPWSYRHTIGFQPVQGQIGLGSGGVFGVGLGRSVQKVFFLPEAQTDFILAVIGDELGLVGILGVLLLYGMIAYAGLRTARNAGTRYEKLLAAGLTSLILCQGILNIFVVLGIAPLTGVPLPFISYAPSNLMVMLASVGLLQNIARPRAQRLAALPGRYDARVAAYRERAADRDRRWRNSGARGAGAGGRGRAASAGR